MTTWTYNPIYDTPYPYNGTTFSFDPKFPVPVPRDHPDYGKTLQEVLNISDEVVDAIVLQAKWNQIRSIRDQLLKDSDWTQGRDVPSNIHEPWAAYRNALRNLTDTTSPEEVVFPAPPQ